MFPENLHLAFEEGYYVHTPAGRGRVRRHRLADIALPTGRLSTGYPGDGLTNQPNPVQPQAAPGKYPVYISVAKTGIGAGACAFVTVVFGETKTVSWEASGEFFTDGGDGCLFDASVPALVKSRRSEMPRDEWGQLKTTALQDGDGNLVLDEGSGVNAIVFRTCDCSNKCYIGRDKSGQMTCFVIDGRIPDPHDNIVKKFLKMFFR
jgi:hypothetical protein